MIGFACGELGCSLREAYDMTWAEFQIRSFGLKNVRDYEAKLFREVAYQVHCAQYMLGKKKPPKKEKFWPIGEIKPKGLTPGQLRAIQRAREIRKNNGTA